MKLKAIIGKEKGNIGAVHTGETICFLAGIGVYFPDGAYCTDENKLPKSSSSKPKEGEENLYLSVSGLKDPKGFLDYLLQEDLILKDLGVKRE